MSKSKDAMPGSQQRVCSAAGVGTAHVCAPEIQLPIKGNRLKLLWATVCPWKREIRISVHAAGIFIAAPPRSRTTKLTDRRRQMTDDMKARNWCREATANIESQKRASRSRPAHCSANWHDEQHAEARRIFRVIQGKGDAGSESEYNCRRISEQAGYLRMAAEVNRLKGIIRNLREIVWEHHSSSVMIPDVCPVCTDRKMKWALEEADKSLSPNPEVRRSGPDATK